MNSMGDARGRGVVDHRNLFPTRTLLTTVLNGTENNSLHHDFHLNVCLRVCLLHSHQHSIHLRKHFGNGGDWPKLYFTYYEISSKQKTVCVIM